MTMVLCLEIRGIVYDANPLTYQSTSQCFLGDNLPSAVRSTVCKCRQMLRINLEDQENRSDMTFWPHV
jgi:hypothetical protein